MEIVTAIGHVLIDRFQYQTSRMSESGACDGDSPIHPKIG